VVASTLRSARHIAPLCQITKTRAAAAPIPNSARAREGACGAAAIEINMVVIGIKATKALWIGCDHSAVIAARAVTSFVA